MTCLLFGVLGIKSQAVNFNSVLPLNPWVNAGGGHPRYWAAKANGRGVVHFRSITFGTYDKCGLSSLGFLFLIYLPFYASRAKFPDLSFLDQCSRCTALQGPMSPATHLCGRAEVIRPSRSWHNILTAMAQVDNASMASAGKRRDFSHIP